MWSTKTLAPWHSVDVGWIVWAKASTSWLWKTYAMLASSTPTHRCVMSRAATQHSLSILSSCVQPARRFFLVEMIINAFIGQDAEVSLSFFCDSWLAHISYPIMLISVTCNTLMIAKIFFPSYWQGGVFFFNCLFLLHNLQKLLCYCIWTCTFFQFYFLKCEKEYFEKRAFL